MSKEKGSQFLLANYVNNQSDLNKIYMIYRLSFNVNVLKWRV